MAEVDSNPVLAWVATLNSGGFISASQSLTVTVNITGAWEIQVPAGVRHGTQVSLATAVFVYPSSDGGANFDSQPLYTYSIPATASTNQTASIRLTTGQYAMRLLSSSPSTSLYVLTQVVVSSIKNV